MSFFSKLTKNFGTNLVRKRTGIFIVGCIAITLASTQDFYQIRRPDNIRAKNGELGNSLDSVISIWLAAQEIGNSTQFGESLIVESKLSNIFESELSIELAKTKGIDYFIDILKLQSNNWQPFLIRYFEKLSRYEYYRKQLLNNSDFLYYLLNNTEKASLDFGSYTKLIGRLTEDKELLNNIEFDNVGKILDNKSKYNNLTPVAVTLYCHFSRIPEFQQSLNENTKESLDAALYKYVEIEPKTAKQYGGMGKDLEKLLKHKASSEKLEPFPKNKQAIFALAYISIGWFTSVYRAGYTVIIIKQPIIWIMT